MPRAPEVKTTNQLTHHDEPWLLIKAETRGHFDQVLCATRCASCPPPLLSRRSSTERLRNTPSRSPLSSHYLFFSRALRKFFPNGAMFLGGSGGVQGQRSKKQKATRYSPGSMTRHGAGHSACGVLRRKLWTRGEEGEEGGGRPVSDSVLERCV